VRNLSWTFRGAESRRGAGVRRGAASLIPDEGGGSWVMVKEKGNRNGATPLEGERRPSPFGD